MKLAHSFSSVTLFETCPYRYMRQRITKDVKDEPGEASLYGERVHGSLEARLRDKTQLPVETARHEPLCVAIERAAEGGELLVEQEMTLDESLSPTGWWDKSAWLRSKLDVLVLKGRTAIDIDWKTGKRKPDFSQLRLFALQTFRHYPQVDTVKSAFIWLRDGKQDQETYTREQANAMWAEWIGRIRRIYDALESDKWPKKPSGLCRGYCPVKDCPHYEERR